MSEQALQTKIMKWLKEHNFWAVKIIVSSHAGTPDIIACSPKGTFIGIEVKYGRNTPSKLQEYHIQEIKNKGGIAFVTWDLETVIYHLQKELVDGTAKEEKRSGDFLL